MELPGYIIDKQIGKGGMARVYLARHIGLDRQVAIKVMNRQLDEDDSGFGERFIHEARIVANLTHRHIVTVYDVGTHDGYHYIAMEYLPGGVTLDHRIKQGLPLAEGIHTISQIAAALGYAHSKDIVHRDVKPENIMYREDGSAVLTDFGIARATKRATRMTATGTVIGTPHYMSPEQAQGQEIGPWSDIYSLGIVLFEVLTGKVPYDAESSIAVVFKHISEPVPQLPESLSHYQPVIERMLAKQPEQRYQDCQQIVADLENLPAASGQLPAGGSTASQTTRIQPASSAGRTEAVSATRLYQPDSTPAGSKKPLLLGGGLLTILLAAGAAYVLLPTAGDDPAATRTPVVPTQPATQAAKPPDEQQPERPAAGMQAAQEKARQLRARAEAEARQKAEAEKARAEAEARKQAEAEKARAEARAREKAEAEAKARAEQQARQRAEREAAAKKARAARETKIRSLLSDAEQQLLNTRLRAAYQSFEQVLRLDSNNRQAKNGIRRVGDRYLALALGQARKGDFDKANRYIRAVIVNDPTHSKLADTQEQVFALREQWQAKQVEQQTAKQAAQAVPEPAATPDENAPTARKKRRAFGGF